MNNNTDGPPKHNPRWDSLLRTYKRCIGLVELPGNIVGVPKGGAFHVLCANYALMYDGFDELDGFEGRYDQLECLYDWSIGMSHLLDNHDVKGNEDNEEALRCFISRFFFDPLLIKN